MSGLAALIPNDTLVACAWLNGVPGVPAAATQLPANNTTWGASGFVVATVVAGSPNVDLPQGEPVVQVDCYAVDPGSGRPLWNVANNIASSVIRALHHEELKQRVVTLPTGYPTARVFQAYCTRNPSRLYDDDGSYACYSLDVFMRWTFTSTNDT